MTSERKDGGAAMDSSATTDDKPRKDMRALVVDDDAGVRLSLSVFLEAAGYDVVLAENGEDAISKFTDTVVDFILMDIMMPELDGFQACERIRKLPLGKYVPIIMLTGSGDTESIQRAYESGATDFIFKPINFSLIQFRIDYVLRATRIAIELSESEDRAINAQRIARIGHIEWDDKHNVTYCSEGIQRILQSGTGKAVGTLSEFLQRVHPDDRENVDYCITNSLQSGVGFKIEHRMLDANEKIRFVLQIGEPKRNKLFENALLTTLQDVTDRKLTEKKIHDLAFYDELTGLPNRKLLLQYTEYAVEHAHRHGRTAALIVIGIDHFKRVSENLGYKCSDELIAKISERIKNCCRSSDMMARDSADSPINYIPDIGERTAARLGSDEYVILLPEIANKDAAQIFIQRVMKAIEEPFDIRETNLFITACVGASTYPSDGLTAGELLNSARIALGYAKESGRGNVQYYSKSLNSRAKRTFSLEHDLHKAIENNDMEVHYQPKLDLITNTITGVEALVRWNHPERGSIPPQEFILIAEESGVINRLGKWIIEKACNDIVSATKKYGRDLHVAINLSPVQLQNAGVIKDILATIESCEIDNSMVEFELTESILVSDLESCSRYLNKFRDSGCRLAIDDFGTGYSSLAYLGGLPFDTLKIDKTFIEFIERDRQRAAIVRGIIKLGHSLGMSIVGEGVETQEQIDYLVREKCDIAQGYLISHAMALADFNEWMSNNSKIAV